MPCGPGGAGAAPLGAEGPDGARGTALLCADGVFLGVGGNRLGGRGIRLTAALISDSTYFSPTPRFRLTRKPRPRPPRPKGMLR
eukprot:1392003-Amorphochlora_amoeboformis.AAC.1